MTKEQELRLRDIFRPSYRKRLESIDWPTMRFAYYTSATTGMNILKGQSLWMRAAACMNDYKEIDYGIKMLSDAIYGSKRRMERLERTAISLHWGKDILIRMLSALNKNEEGLTTNTYLACVSENIDEDNERGRLSMWRAYGRRTGVAIVMHAAPLLHTERLPLSLHPVSYLGQASFESVLDNLIDHIDQYGEEIQAIRPTETLQCFLESLLFSLFSLKHPGFKEEREWRLIYQERSGLLPHDIVSVDGVPQIVYKVPLSAPASPREGLNLENALDHIIIGPSQYAAVIQKAFVRILRELGIQDAKERVTLSNIPLRAER